MCIFHKWQYYVKRTVSTFLNVPYPDSEPLARVCTKCDKVQYFEEHYHQDYVSLSAQEERILREKIAKDPNIVPEED